MWCAEGNEGVDPLVTVHALDVVPTDKSPHGVTHNMHPLVSGLSGDLFHEFSELLSH